MSASGSLRASDSAKALTFAACASFVPIGIVTVLLGPILPRLKEEWFLNDSQAGFLITVQYLAATLGVGFSGWQIARRGYRFVIKAGLLLVAAGVALLLVDSKVFGMAGIATYGIGLGFAIPASNLLVAEVNPRRRSAALNLLNFCWSAGAVACPFLVAAAVKNLRVPLFLELVVGVSLVAAVGIEAMPASIVEPAVSAASGRKDPMIGWKSRALFVLATLFFVYVGTENAFGMWVASYAKGLGSLTVAMALMTPSFFYGAIMLGRSVAPLVLRTVDDVRLTQAGLLVACGGMVGLVLSRALPGVAVSACLAGLGLSVVYPITVAVMSREFGQAASRVASLMFTLSNLGGSSLPWMVGVASNHFGTLKAGLAVPLIGAVAMFFLYLREWKPATVEQLA